MVPGNCSGKKQGQVYKASRDPGLMDLEASGNFGFRDLGVLLDLGVVKPKESYPNAPIPHPLPPHPQILNIPNMIIYRILGVFDMRGDGGVYIMGRDYVPCLAV